MGKDVIPAGGILRQLVRVVTGGGTVMTGTIDEVVRDRTYETRHGRVHERLEIRRTRLFEARSGSDKRKLEHKR